MTVKIELEPEVEASLLLQARESGLSLDAYVEQVLRERSRAVPAHDERTSAEMRRDKKGLVELFAPLRGLDLDFSRNQSTGRPADV